MKSALIAGSTGLTGKSLLYTLLSNNDYTRIFILVRKEIAIKDSRLTQVVFDYDNPEEYQKIPMADEVYCCLGTTIKKAGSQDAFRKVDLEYPVRLAKTCSEKGYKKFLIVTAIDANTSSRFFYNKTKGETEEKIKSFPFNSLYFCRPSLILGNRPEFRISEQIGKLFVKFISPFLLGTLKKYRGIEAMTIARAMVALANQSQSGVHIIESPELQKLGNK